LSIEIINFYLQNDTHLFLIIGCNYL